MLWSEKKKIHRRSIAALQWSPLRQRLPRQVRLPGAVALSRSLEIVSISLSTGIRVFFGSTPKEARAQCQEANFCK